MLTRKTNNYSARHLRVGELVEIFSRDEILRTVDDHGTLDALPLMPEMLKFVGKRFHVFRRADKVCGSLENSAFGFRRMKNTVLLEGLRCNGEAQGGCQAACMILWKEAWLQRLSPGNVRTATVTSSATSVTNDEASSPSLYRNECTESAVLKTTREYLPDSNDSDGETFVCQFTELKRASSPASWWDMRPYIRVIWSGNVSIWQCVRALLILAFKTFQRLRKGVTYPHLEQGKLKKTPRETLNLQPG